MRPSIPDVGATHVKANSRPGLRLHPLSVRIMHWVNAAAMIIMIMSGWKIYNDEVIFGWLYFPDIITLGTWAQHGLQWHFFGMWILTLNGLAYLGYGLVSGRFRAKLLPISAWELIDTVRDALTLHLKHDDLTHYNAVQKLLYVGIILVGIVTVLSGLSIWKPVQFSDRAAGAFPVHDGDRAFPRRSRHARLDGAALPRRDGDGRTGGCEPRGRDRSTAGCELIEPGG